MQKKPEIEELGDQNRVWSAIQDTGNQQDGAINPSEIS